MSTVANIRDILFGPNRNPAFVGSDWDPSTGEFPQYPHEGDFYVATSDGTVAGREFITGDLILWLNGMWIDVGNVRDVVEQITDVENRVDDVETDLDDIKNDVENIEIGQETVNAAIDNLNNAQQTIADLQNQQQQALNNQQQILDNAIDTIGDVTSQLNVISGEVSDNVSRLNDQALQLQEQATKINDTATLAAQHSVDLADQAQQIQSLILTSSDHTTRLATITNDLANHALQLSDQAEEIGELLDQTTNIGADVNQLQQQYITVNNQLTQQGSDIADLLVTTATNTQNISAVQSDVSNNASELLQHSQQILDLLTVTDDINTDVQVLATSVSTNTDNIAANTSAVNGLVSRVEVNEGSITALSSDIISLQTNVDNLETNVLSNSSALSNLETRVTQTENDITVNSSQITALNSSLVDAENNISANSSAIETLDTRIVQTEDELSVVSSNLTSVHASLIADDLLVFRQPTEPTIDDVESPPSGVPSLSLNFEAGLYLVVGIPIGSIWYDTSNGNKPYTYDGTNWVDTQDQLGIANSSAITSLDSRVTQTEDELVTMASDVTTLQSDLNSAIEDINSNATAISGLSTRITQTETEIDNISSDITTLSSRVEDNETGLDSVSTAVSSLETRVTSNETELSIHATDLTALQSSVSQSKIFVQPIAPTPSDFDDNTVPLNSQWFDSDNNFEHYVWSVEQSPAGWVPVDNTQIFTNATAISGLTTRITDNEDGLIALSSDVTSLSSALDLVEQDTAANATAISNLQTTVTDQGNQIDTVSSSVTSLEGTVTDNANNITANSSAISSLQTRTTQTENSITTMSSQITTLENDLDLAEQNISANATAVNGLDTRVTSAEGTITSISSDVTALSNRVTDTETGISQNSSAISSLESTVQAHDDELVSQASQIAQLQASVNEGEIFVQPNPPQPGDFDGGVIPDGTQWFDSDDNNAHYVWLNGQWMPVNNANVQQNADAITALTARVTQTEDDVTSLSAQYTQLGSDLTNLDSEVSGNSTAISNLQTTVTNHGNSITSLSTDVTTLQTNVSDLEGTVAGNASAISGLDTRVTNAEGSITSQSSQITQLQSDVTNAQNDADGALTQSTANATAIDGLDTRVTSAEGTITAHSTQLTNLESEVTDLDNRVVTNTNAVSGLDTRVTTTESQISAISTDVTELEASTSAIQGEVDASNKLIFDPFLNNGTRFYGSVGTGETTQSFLEENNPNVVDTTSGLQITNFQRIYSVNTIRVDTTKTYYGKFTIRRDSVDATDAGRYYAGFRCLDENFNSIGSNTYFIASAFAGGTNVGEVYTFDGTIGPDGDVNWPAGTVHARLVSFVHYNVSSTDNVSTIQELSFLDISELKKEENARSTAINSLTARVDDNESGLTALSSQVTDLESNITNIESNVNSNSAAISTLSTRVTDNENSITSQSSQITQLQSDVTNAQNDASANAAAISGLDTRVTTTENNISTITSQVTSLQTNVDNIENDVSANGTAITSLDTRITSNETEISNNSQQITTLQSELNTLEGDVVANSTAIDTVGTQVEQNESQISTTSNRITSLHSSLLANEIVIFRQPTEPTVDDVDDPPGDVPTLSLNFSSEEYLVKGIPVNSIWYDTDDGNKPYVFDGENWVDTQDQLGVATANAVSGLETRVDATESGITTIASDITSLETSFQSLQGDVGANSTAITGLDSRVEANENSITTISSDITSLETRVSNNETGISGNSSAISGLDTRVTANEGDISTQSSLITQLQSGLNDLESETTTNATAISNLDTRVTANETNLTAVSNDVTSLEVTTQNLGGAVTSLSELTYDPFFREGTRFYGPTYVGKTVDSFYDLETANVVDTVDGMECRAYKSFWSTQAFRVDETQTLFARFKVRRDATNTALPGSYYAGLRCLDENYQAISNNIYFITDGSQLGDVPGETYTWSSTIGPNGSVGFNAGTKYVRFMALIHYNGNSSGNVSTVQELWFDDVTELTNETNARAAADTALTARIDDNESGITALASDITSLETELSTLDGELSSTNTALSALTTRVTDNENSISSQASQITQLNIDVAAAQNTADGAQANTVSNANAISGLDTRVTQTESGITSLSSDITSLQTSVTNVEGDVTANSNSISSLESRVTTTENSINSISTDVTNLSNSVTDIENDVAGNAAAVDTLTTEVDIVEGRVATESNRITSLSATNMANQIAIFRQPTEPTINDLDTVPEDIPTLSLNFSTEEYLVVGIPVNSIWYDTYDGNKPYVFDGENWVVNQDGGIVANATAISGLDTRVTDNEDEITAISTDITQLETDVVNLKTDVSAHSSALTSLDSRVTTTENTIASQASDLTVLQADLSSVEGYVSVTENGLGYVQRPKGASFNQSSSSVTGAFKIIFPRLKGNTMLRFTVRVFNYLTNTSFDVNVGGYTYTNGWSNVFANITGNKADVDYNIRFGDDGVKSCIWIGEIDSKWQYPKVTVVDLVTGHSNYDDALWNDGWDIQVVTAFDNVDTIKTDNLADSNDTKNVGGTPAQQLLDTIADLQTGTTANASALSNLDVRVENNEGEILAIADQLTVLSTEIDGNTATLTQHAESIDGIKNTWSVRADNNGIISGISLVSELDENGEGPKSSFTIQSDQFKVIAPGSSSGTGELLFYVDQGSTYILSDKLYLYDSVRDTVVSPDFRYGPQIFEVEDTVSRVIFDGTDEGVWKDVGDIDVDIRNTGNIVSLEMNVAIYVEQVDPGFANVGPGGPTAKFRVLRDDVEVIWESEPVTASAVGPFQFPLAMKADNNAPAGIHNYKIQSRWDKSEYDAGTLDYAIVYSSNGTPQLQGVEPQPKYGYNLAIKGNGTFWSTHTNPNWEISIPSAFTGYVPLSATADVYISLANGIPGDVPTVIDQTTILARSLTAYNPPLVHQIDESKSNTTETFTNQPYHMRCSTQAVIGSVKSFWLRAIEYSEV